MYNPRNRKYASVVAAVICCFFIVNHAVAEDDDRHGHPGLRAKLQLLKHHVIRNTENIATNAGHIADNFAAATGNSADISGLDARVTELEAGIPRPGRTIVEVDCMANPDALLRPPINGRFPDDTTYRLSGACHGPLYVTEARVYFVGVEPAAAIVLPGSVGDPSTGAVFADGAHDLRIQDLSIDASAWGTGAIANHSDAAGIQARNAFVRVIDSRIVGGERGINPFRSAIIETWGLVEITGFVNNALSVGDQSVISARGRVVIDTAVADGSDPIAVDVYRGGVMDFRGGVTIKLPPPNEDIGFLSAAISVDQQSHLRVRNSPRNDIHGVILVNGNSSAYIDAANIGEDLVVGDGSTVTLNSVVLNEAGVELLNSSVVRFHSVMQTGGDIEAESGSVLEMEGLHQTEGVLVISRTSHASIRSSSTGEIFVDAVASLEFSDGQFGGAVVQSGAVANFFNASALGDIKLFPPSHLIYKQEEGLGLLNGYTIYLCGNTSSIIDPAIAATGMVVDGCLGDPFD